MPVTGQRLERDGCAPREIRLPRKVSSVDADQRPRPTPLEALQGAQARLQGRADGGNGSAIVDGAPPPW